MPRRASRSERALRLVTALALIFSTVVWGAVPASAAISFVGSNSATSIGGSSVTIPAPAGVLANDVMLAVVTWADGPPETLTPPAGWNFIRHDDDGGGSLSQDLFYRVATGSEPPSYQFNLSTSAQMTGVIVAYRGVDTGSPIDAEGGQANPDSSSIPAPSITTTVSDSQLVGFFGWAKGIPIDPDPAMSERAEIEDGGLVATEVADEVLGATGPTGTRAASGAPETAISIGQMVALAPAPPPPDTYFDQFTAIAYNGSDGTLDWTPTPWIEIGETTNPSAGLVQVAPNSFDDNQCLSGDCLRLGGYSSGNFGAERSVDLTGATTATLTYTWGVDTDEGYYALGVQPKVQVWDDVGSTWVTVHSLPEGQEGPTDQAASWDITSYADANTKIRFITDVSGDIQGFVFFDDIQVEFEVAPGSYDISGTVFEDVVGDVLNDGAIGDGNNPGLENVVVNLYHDLDGDGIAEASDPYVDTQVTDANGDYVFTGQSNGKYFVTVNSFSIQPTAGIDTLNGWLATDVWPEQTYGPAVSECADGLGGTVDDPTAGPCYGGRRAGVSDGQGSWWLEAEHLGKVAVASGDTTNVDFGFSFNVVTNTLAGDAQDDDPAATLKSVQGSLRQFLTNANATLGPNPMRFVPAEPTNDSGGGGAWWRIDVSNQFLTVRGPTTTVDGTAYDLSDGATVVEPNPGTLGTGGVVGTDSLVLAQVDRPELELAGSGGVADGLRIEADDSTVRQLAFRGFVASAVRVGDPGLPVDYTNITVEENLVGSAPGALADPGAGNRPDDAILVNHADDGFIQNNVVVFADEFGIRIQASGTDGWTISGNEVRDTGLVINGGLDLKGANATADGNLVADTGGTGVVLAGAGNVLENNTIENSGQNNPFAGVTALLTSDAEVRKNTITGSSRGGVFVGILAPNGVLITQNTFGGNAANAIDLLEAGAVSPATTEGDGISVNTGVPPACGIDAGASNEGLDAPIIDTANTTTVTGTACAGATIEVFRAVADGDASDTLAATDYGEGVEFLGSTVADGVTGSWSLTGITTLSSGDAVSATATNASNSTSEFGPNAPVVGFVVNSTGNGNDISLGDGICDTGGTVGPDPECTLRAAISESNVHAGDDLIEFAIPVADPGHSGGVWTIAPTGTPLTTIVDTVTIDGTTQSGYGGTPVIQVDGGNFAGGEDGFYVLGGDGTVIQAIAVTNFPNVGVIINADTVSVLDSYVGVLPDGVTGAGNTNEGIIVSAGASGTIIDGNLIGDQGNAAITLNDTTTGSVITNNIIGTDTGGTFNLGNGQGVWADTSGSAVVGGPNAGDGNVITNSTFDGIELRNSGPGISILRNSIYGNGSRGINAVDVGDPPSGVTPNDPGDGDSGPNDLLNYPEITSATETAGSVTVDFDLDVIPAGNYRVEFFTNPSGADGSGYGEGETFQSSTVVAHLGAGAQSYSHSFPGSVGDVITATATRDLGGSYGPTSEFSAWYTVTPGFNNPPVANDDAAGAGEDAFVVINVKVNDTDVEDGIPAGPAAVVAEPLHGTALANAGGMGTVTYTPDPNFYGTDQFTYTIDDSGGETSNVATVTVTVAGAPDPPTATDDGPYTVLEDGSLAVGAHEQQFTSEWGSAGSGNGQFSGHRGVAVAPDGSVYVADTANHRIQKFDPAGSYLLQWGTNGVGNGQFDTPMGIAVADDGTVYVVDSFNHRIQYFDANGTYLGQFGTNGSGDAQFESPRGIDIGPDGNLYVADAYNHRIQVLSPAGTYLRKWGGFGTGNGQFDAPRDLVVSRLGSVYVSDSFNHRIQKFDSLGNYLLQWGTNGTADGEFDFPRGIDVDAAGNVYIVDSFNDRVQIFDQNGAFLHAFGTSGSGPSQFAAAYGLAFGPSGDLYAGDIGNSRIQRFAPVGILFNDIDPDLPGDALTATVSTDVVNGVLVLNLDGSFTYDPDPDYFGPDSFVYQVCDTTPTCDTGTVFITIDPVNDEPSFTSGVNIGLGEDNGPATILGWATGMSAGPANEAGQALSFNVTGNTNPGLFSAGPSLDPVSGDLSFTAAADAFGVASITIELQDNGGTANGGDDTSPAAVFTITVNSVNDAPSFTSGGNVSVDEDSGAYAAAWAGAISPGPANESGQTVSFNVTGNTNPGLFSVAPTVNSAGTLSFTPAGSAFGSADITIEAQDNGGTAGGGVDTSAPVVFTIAVGPVNDEPSFTGGGNVGLGEDNGPTVVSGWASGMSAGPANESAQSLTFNVTGNTNPGLFAAGPALDAVSGDLTFTTAADEFGAASITVELQDDGGTANGGDDTSPPVVFTITVGPVNDPPSFNSGGNVAADEDSGAYSAPWASSISPGPANESGQSVTFNITGNTNPGLFSSGPAVDGSGTLTFTPASEAFGSASITIEAQDDGGGADTSAPVVFDITLNPVNDEPSFVPGGNVVVSEDTSWAALWAGSISPGPANESGQTVTFNITGNTNPALFAVAPAIDGAGMLTFTTASDAFGSADITVEAQDNGGTANGGDDTSPAVVFTIIVNPVNDPPVLDPVGAQAGDEGTLIGFVATASDVDLPANTLTFTLEDGLGLVPPGAVISGGGVFSWTPIEAQGPGVYTFDVVVTDDGTPNLEDRETITVTVGEVNTPPALNPIGNRLVNEGNWLIFAVTTFDPDVPSSFTYTLEDGPGAVPPGATIGPVLGIFGWNPTEADGPGTYTFDVVVTDNTGLQDRETITVTVNEVNLAPVLDPIGDRSTDELAPVSFTATASDTDVPANALTFAVAGAPAGATITAGGDFSWTPTEAQGPGSYTFDVVVSDNGLPVASDFETITITVGEVDAPPVLSPIGDQTIAEGTSLSFIAIATDPDLPPDALTFSVVGAPAGATIDPASGVFQWTPTEAQGPGLYAFDIVVTDDDSLEDRETVTVSVDEVNTAPLIDSPGDRIGAEGLPVSVALSGSDADLPANGLTWTASGLPGGLAINPTTGLITGVIDPAAAGTYSVTVTLTDDGAPSLAASVAFQWLVEPNEPPVAAADFYTTDPLGVVVVPGPGVLANDVDPDGDSLSAAVLVNPAAGALTFNPDGSFTYIHNGGDTVEDVFVYQADDGRGGIALGTVKLSITKLNLPPILTADLLTLLEDGVSSVAPLVNDSDPNGDALALVDFTQPEFGSLVAGDGGVLEYIPPANFFGETTATYRASDGQGGVTSGIISIVVTPVNDFPVGGADFATATSYLPFSLTVLDNDGDIDGDALTIASVIGGAGRVTVNDDGTITYQAAAGFVGVDEFQYVVDDGLGGRDTVWVRVSVSENVFNTAIALGEVVGSPTLGFMAPTPDSVEPVPTIGFNEGVTLLADAFFQSLGALRLPILFLGLALGTVVVLGGFTEVPLLLASRRRRHYSVVMLDREHRLAARRTRGVDGYPLYYYEPTASGFRSLNKPVTENGITWVPVDSPNGDAWVDAAYLTEAVDLKFFLEDDRPVAMLKRLADELYGRKDLSALFSERGLAIALTNEPVLVGPEVVHEALVNRYKTPETQELWDKVLEPFAEALRAAEDLDSRSGHSRTALIPVELWNFEYLAVNAPGHPPWLVYFEYRGGKPRIVGLGIDV